jgi:hypothetical protein
MGDARGEDEGWDAVQEEGEAGQRLLLAASEVEEEHKTLAVRTQRPLMATCICIDGGVEQQALDATLSDQVEEGR